MLVLSSTDIEATMFTIEIRSHHRQICKWAEVLLTHSLLAAIKVFYNQNVISVDIELFKLANINSPAASDISLAKRLVVTFNGSCEWRDQVSRSFNTIDLHNLFARCSATFPLLQSIVVYTDGTTLPCTSLIDIFQDCHNSPNTFTTIDFCNVGQSVATTHSGLTLTVKFKELADIWHEICELSANSRMRALHEFGDMHKSLASQAHQAFLTRMVFEEVHDDDTRDNLEIFRKSMARHSKIRAMPYLNDNVYWTNFAFPYVWYAPV